MNRKIKVGIIGTGNIGTDLLMKIMRSKYLECSIFLGVDPNSPGIKRAKEMGIETSYESINYIKEHPDCCEIAFDATSAKAHLVNALILEKAGIFAIDLTPARVGKMCVPVINLQECLNEKNVNMVTCGGQATVPIAHTLTKLYPNIDYIEIVAGISSKSAGPGTRANIDEFTQTTGDALKYFSNAKKSKAIIILNSAEPPVNMRNTLYALIDNPDMEKIKNAIHDVVVEIQKYVPGYHLLYEPVYEDGRLSIGIEVIGQGDYLPKYAGNLDIITCAAIEVAEQYAKRRGGFDE